MEQNLKNGGMTPSAIALKDSLSQKPDTSSAPTMLTPYQKELLLRAQIEIDERLDQSPRLKSLLDRMHRVEAGTNSDTAMETEGGLQRSDDEQASQDREQVEPTTTDHI
jgi:hypothetical protein